MSDFNVEHRLCALEINRLQAERDRALVEKAEAERLAFNLREALGVLLSRARALNGEYLCDLPGPKGLRGVRIELSSSIDLAKKAMAGEELVP